jgi:hypothetical protein
MGSRVLAFQLETYHGRNPPDNGKRRRRDEGFVMNPHPVEALRLRGRRAERLLVRGRGPAAAKVVSASPRSPASYCSVVEPPSVSP